MVNLRDDIKNDSLLLVDKPAGITSFGVVARVRRLLAEQLSQKPKHVKVGHTGTLDPFATGLMLILTGKMTKEAERFSKLDKVYEATVVLGAKSSTGDPEGEIVEDENVSSNEFSTEKIGAALGRFVGKIRQTPPIFSAIKIGGERAYKLARRGQMPKMPEREVEIYALELLGYGWPELKIRVHVSSGTYIRTLSEDIGRALGTVAYTKSLRRTRVGQYDVSDAIKI